MERNLDRISRRVWLGGIVFLGITALAVLAALLAPLPTGNSKTRDRTAQRVPMIHPATRPSGELEARISRQVQELIRPLQGVAAVKDDGTAAKMAARLKLQGIVNMGGQYVAYVSVDKGSVVSIRRGETILEFSVLNVEEKKVVLSREGVQVVLPQSPS